MHCKRLVTEGGFKVPLPLYWLQPTGAVARASAWRPHQMLPSSLLADAMHGCGIEWGGCQHDLEAMGVEKGRGESVLFKNLDR